MNFEDTILGVRLRLTLLVMIGFITTSAASPRAQSHQVQRLPPVGSTVPVSGYTIKHVYPHDPKAFTKGFVYDRTTFKQLRTFPYTGEGWGLTHNATSLIMSDGSASIRFLDPKTMAETHRILVSDAGIIVRDLNELEWVNGEIYANVWQTNFVARIAPTSGKVLGWINLTGLLSPEEARSGADVLNGIAYDA